MINRPVNTKWVEHVLKMGKKEALSIAAREQVYENRIAEVFIIRFHFGNITVYEGTNQCRVLDRYKEVIPGWRSTKFPIVIPGLVGFENVLTIESSDDSAINTEDNVTFTGSSAGDKFAYGGKGFNHNGKGYPASTNIMINGCVVGMASYPDRLSGTPFAIRLKENCRTYTGNESKPLLLIEDVDLAGYEYLEYFL